MRQRIRLIAGKLQPPYDKFLSNKFNKMESFSATSTSMGVFYGFGIYGFFQSKIILCYETCVA